MEVEGQELEENQVGPGGALPDWGDGGAVVSAVEGGSGEGGGGGTRTGLMFPRFRIVHLACLLRPESFCTSLPLDWRRQWGE